MLRLPLLLALVLALPLPGTSQRSGGSARPAAVATPDSARSVVRAARAQVGVTVGYDPSYVRIPYPGGDVPGETGVCTDVVIRAFRRVGIDLQRAVHEDMRRSFAAYPQLWGRRTPDANIDHRRVPNLMAYFRRAGRALPISADPAAYRPGDVVAWDLGRGVRHIGIVSDRMSRQSHRYLILHNIGAGAREEDVLFAWRIIGHYRHFR
jgi:uncharacterized protein